MQSTSHESAAALRCPTCAASLVPANDVLLCRPCALAYPQLVKAPQSLYCCYPNPMHDLAGWRARAHLALQELVDAQRKAHDASLTRASKLTRTRLELLERGYAGQIDCVTELLAPLLREYPSSDKTTYDALGTQPLTQPTTLFGYAANVFRDWVWGAQENTQALELIRSATDRPFGDVLVLGAGAGRLAWDISGLTDARVVAVDLNPYTSLLGAALTGGKPVELWEFPLAPRQISDVAIKHTLRAPSARDNLQWVLADARYLPFDAQAFDTVLTPWYTDVVQEQPTATAKRVNNLLKEGGQWLNFGSVSFADANVSDCLTLSELLERVEQQGFDTPTCVEATGSYLRSPHSRFSRVEGLHAFSATKQQHQEKPKQDALPLWLRDCSQSVPALERFQHQAMSTQIHAFLMSLVDDQRSIADIAQVLQQRQLMDASEAQPVVQNFLRKLYLADNSP